MKGVLLGTAVGDALGAPFETKRPDDPALLAWDGRMADCKGHKFMEGLEGLGHWTDDTYFSCALAFSVVDNGGEYEPSTAADAYLTLHHGGSLPLSRRGRQISGPLRGTGTTTRTALENLARGEPWWRSGVGEDKPTCGNGTAMRAACLGVRYRNRLGVLPTVCALDARITHAHPLATVASTFVALVAGHLALGESPEDAITDASLTLVSVFEDRTRGFLAGLAAARVLDPVAAQVALGRGFTAVEAVRRAIAAFSVARDYRESVTVAVRGGGDTDTVAAIAGAWAGLVWEIPDEYLEVLEAREAIVELDQMLWEAGE